MAMEESERLAKNAKNVNIDEENWELKVNKYDVTFFITTICIDFYKSFIDSAGPNNK